MQSEVLPSELQMVAPPTIPQARSYMFKQGSDLTEYDMNKNNRIRINIPRLQRSYLMKNSYLRFRINMDYTSSTSAALWLDRCGAFGIFDRIEVYDYLGGTLLEQTNNLPALITLLGDLNYTITDFNTELTATQGYDGSNVFNNTTDFDRYEIRTANSGFTLIPPATVGSVASFMTWEFAIPIPSFLGLFSDKYVPLHNGFSIDFFLNDVASAFVSRSNILDSSSTSISITQTWLSNVEWCCQIMELGEVAESMVMAQNPLVMHSTQFRNFRDIVLGSGTQSTFRLDMNLNVVSLRNIRFMMRPSFYTGLAYPVYGHRIRNFLQNWNFQYGSSYLPEIAGIQTRSSVVPVTKNSATGTLTPQGSDWYKSNGFTQGYMELLKTVDSSKTSTINWYEYKIDTVGSAQFTVATSAYGVTGNFTLAANLTLPPGTAIQITAQTGGSLSTTAGTYYYVMANPAPTATTFSVSATLGGAGLTGVTTATAVAFTVIQNDYFGGLGNTVPVSPAISTATLSGKFAAGVDTRLSTKNAVSGIDTNGLLVSINGQFDRDQVPNMVQANLDVFAEFDTFIQVIPGVATTVTF
jgi:hypothetical protein